MIIFFVVIRIPYGGCINDIVKIYYLQKLQSISFAFASLYPNNERHFAQIEEGIALLHAMPSFIIRYTII